MVGYIQGKSDKESKYRYKTLKLLEFTNHIVFHVDKFAFSYLKLCGKYLLKRRIKCYNFVSKQMRNYLSRLTGIMKLQKRKCADNNFRRI